MTNLKDLIIELKKKKGERSNPRMGFKASYTSKEDIFLGIAVPTIRKIAKAHITLSFLDLKELISSKFHDFRLCALLILVYKFQSKNAEISKKEQIVKFYLENHKFVDNWDLVDSSAYQILGEFLVENKDVKYILENFINSENQWEKRIAIISTFSFIKKGNYEEIFNFSEKFLEDKDDLIHKACGWMLREVYKKDVNALKIRFLNKNYKKMPRTMLRYTIEKMPESQRKSYLKGEI